MGSAEVGTNLVVIPHLSGESRKSVREVNLGGLEVVSASDSDMGPVEDEPPMVRIP